MVIFTVTLTDSCLPKPPNVFYVAKVDKISADIARRAIPL